MMKLKNNVLLFSSLLTIAFLGKESNHKAVNAETAPSSQVSSTATINFKANDAVVSPVDPTDPDSIFVPDSPNAPSNQKGPLSIDFVSTFNFGAQDITTKDKIYNAALVTGKKSTDTNSVEKPNYIQATDNTGESLGWGLSVKQLTQLKNNGSELSGAQIKLANITAITASESNAVKPIVSPNLILVPGNEVTVTTAKAGSGEGTWITRFGSDVTQAKSSVQLSVPGASVKKVGNYTATLQWTLNKTPDGTVG